jgi:hypothetical protein
MLSEDNKKYLAWIRNKHTSLGDSEAMITQLVAQCQAEFDKSPEMSREQRVAIYRTIRSRLLAGTLDSFALHARLHCNS